MELVKVNSNASFIPETGSSAISIVARNHLGHVFVSTCKRVGNCQSMEEPEVCTALVGISLLGRFYKERPMIPHLDCSVVAKELEARELALSGSFPLM